MKRKYIKETKRERERERERESTSLETFKYLRKSLLDGAH
jgi:hypothetical protein